MKKTIFALFIVLACTQLTSAGRKSSKQADPTLAVNETIQTKATVCYHVNPPAVVNPNRPIDPGLEVDMINIAAKNQKIEIEYVEVKDFKELLKLTQEGKCDVAAAGITRTAKRMESGLMFSHTTLRSGIAIMTRTGFAEFKFNTDNLGIILRSPIVRQLMLGLFLIFLFFAVVYYACDTTKANTHKSWRIGIPLGFWRIFQFFSTAGQGNEPHNLRLKVVCISAWLTGFLFTCFCGAVMLLGIQSEIKKSSAADITDLAQKRVAVKANTTSDIVLSRFKTKETIRVASLEEAAEKFEAGLVDCIVHDLPSLDYLKKTRFDGKVEVYDQSMPEALGLAFPAGSQLKDRFNFEFAKIQDNENPDNTWVLLNKRYMGK